ncbi:MAG: 50S ribosomal protein L13 [Deltaproteobacteria bacterium]|nr:50S ribosomal protein L13 [Deltaproteobacteria bacterium]
MRTHSAKRDQIVRKFYLVDATGLIVGRTASKIASILRGKNKPYFTPNLDTGDFVIVVNAEKIRFTGKKEHDKAYYRHTKYPGGIKSTTPERLRVDKPAEILKKAVEGMLPRGPLGRTMFRKLMVYAGPKHPHAAQKPEPLKL